MEGYSGLQNTWEDDGHLTSDLLKYVFITMNSVRRV
jgi:hypothetical protein